MRRILLRHLLLHKLRHSGDPDFPATTIFESPQALGFMSARGTAVVNCQQTTGETEGLALGRYFNFSFENSTLNLGFDSQSVGGLDWVLRVDSNQVAVLEAMIDDGRIVVAGANFSVEYNAIADVTYIQQTVTTVLGDCNLDGVVDFSDIPPFVVILPSGAFLEQADCNQDTVVDFSDIGMFIAILISQ